MIKVIKDNFNFACKTKVIDGDLINKYESVFEENGIFYNKSISSGYCIASGSATVEAWDSAYIYCKSTIECKISDKAIIRRIDTNTIQFCSYELKFEKL